VDPGVGARRGIGRVRVMDPSVGAAPAAEAVSFYVSDEKELVDPSIDARRGINSLLAGAPPRQRR